ncbi:MAG TPA: caspase family protein [Blastocatellia bacterium]|nr:caspase family protein [Blastocatellia bacterium]
MGEQSPQPRSAKQKKKTGQARARDLEIKPEEIAPAAARGVGSRSFALLIGVSRYANLPEKAQLKYADRDAQALRDFLISDKGGFLPEHVTLLTNEDATWEQISRELNNLQNRCGPDSLALIFFAGHGVVSPAKQGFLLAYDSKPDDLFVTAIEMNRFNSVLKGIRARSTVIISDACHSGTIGDVVSPEAADKVMNVTASAFADPTGRPDQSSFIFSAASPTQTSLEMKTLEHGLFTHHILQGLDGKADANSDGVVNAGELYNYVSVHVRAEAEKENRSQVPEFNAFYDRSIPMAYLNETGLEHYKKWFESDPVISRVAAAFDEALKEGRLTRPELQSAWRFYQQLHTYHGTPAEMAKAKQDALLARLTGDAQAVIERFPADPALWEEAGEWLEKAFELSRHKPLRARQRYCAAMARYHAGETAAAERECEVALNIIEEEGLNDSLLCLKVGQFFRRQRHWEKAGRGYKLALRAEEKMEWRIEYGEVLMEAGDLLEAEAQLQRAREINPDHPECLRLLADVILRGGKTERVAEALDHVTRARNLRPDDISIEEIYGWSLLRSGDPARAVPPLRKVALKRLADDRLRDTALLRVSQAYAAAGDLGRGVSALRDAIAQGSTRPAVYESLGRLLEKRGDLSGAIAAGERAVSLTQASGPEKAMRVWKVAEYLERAGRLDEAAFKYREAARSAADVKVSTLLDTHANALFHRAGKAQEAGTLSRQTTAPSVFAKLPVLLIIPGGREALENLTGVRIAPYGDGIALAVIFDACLRDATLLARLKYFYEKYPELVKRLEGKKVRIGGRLDLPAAGQPAPEGAQEALKFFGCKDSGSRREINQKEFEAKKTILEALGGDAQKLYNGEQTFIRLDNDEFAVIAGMDTWMRRLKEVNPARPDLHLLSFFKDAEAMRLYVGLAMLPEEVVIYVLANMASKETMNDFPEGLYFAAPYLRFTQESVIAIPGQNQGTLNWQKILKARTIYEALQIMFKRDHGEALYLFAALSAAGEVGDLIARSPLLEQFYRSIKENSILADREPFDLMDLLAYMRVENDRLRLPDAVEAWLTAGKENVDPVPPLLSQIGQTPAGKTIPLVKQIAALDAIQRERPDWVADVEAVKLIAAQVGNGQEAQLELALDLEMSKPQLEAYLARAARLDAISVPARKTAAIAAFQSAFELLRLRARKAALESARVGEIADRLLQQDPDDDKFIYNLAAVVLGELAGVSSPASGEEAEDKLILAMAEARPLTLWAGKKDERAGALNDPARSADYYAVDVTQAEQERIRQTLERLNHTRFRDVITALTALDALEKNPGDAAALEKLKAAAGQFILPEPPPLPKKGKSKQPVVQPPTLKELIAQLAAPVDSASLTEIRFQMGPLVSESLLGVVYATLLELPGKDSPYSGIVQAHELGTDPWGEAILDSGRKGVRGNIGRLGHALARLRAEQPSGEAATQSIPAHPDVRAALITAYQMVGFRGATDRALEYVARAIDLGENTLALSVLGDRKAQMVVSRLDHLLTPRRARWIRARLDQQEVKRAVTALTLSELYHIGQKYFALRLEDSSAAALAQEPGAIGAMASAAAGSAASGPARNFPGDLTKEIRQFGMPMKSRAGMFRLDLAAAEPYEHAFGFGDIRRGIERYQEFKLALARSCYRRGYSAALALSPLLAQAAMTRMAAEWKVSVAGTPPPERDWLNLILAMRAFGDADLSPFVITLTSTSHARLLEEKNWKDETK